MTSINWTGNDICIDRRDRSTLLHLTKIRLEGNADVRCPLEEEEVDLGATNVPKSRQYVDRKIILGSRMALVASMRYSAFLAERIAEACRATPLSEHYELPEDENCPFIQSISTRLLDIHEPIRQMRAFREDFRYVLVYLPSWKASYRIQRDGNDTRAIEEARIGINRPVYFHRECDYLWDFQRRMMQLERTLIGRSPLPITDFDVWDDIVKLV